MLREVPVTLMPSDSAFSEKPVKTVMLLSALPPTFLDDLFSGILTDEEKRDRENYIMGEILHFEAVLRILSSSRLSVATKKQYYELILAHSEYLVSDFCWTLSHCSVKSLEKHRIEIKNFFAKKCKFSNGTSNYLFDCFVKKQPFQIDVQDNGDSFQTNHHFLATTMPLEGLSYNEPLHIPLPLPEPNSAYGRNFKKDSFVKYMLIYHFLRFQCYATGIARMLQDFNVDTDASDAQIRCIKSQKQKQYKQNLAYVLSDLDKIFTVGFIYYSSHEWFELSMDGEQFRFRPKSA